jgi:hypothetical protein
MMTLQCAVGNAAPIRRTYVRPASKLVSGLCRAASSSRGTAALQRRRLSIDCCSNEREPQQEEQRSEGQHTVSSRHVGRGLFKTTIADVGRHCDRVLAVLTPKQEGDMMDVVLCSVSMMVFVYTAMQLYRLYAWSYYMAGFHTFAEMLN